MTRTKLVRSAAGLVVVAAIAMACSAIPVPLPFQAAATPPAGAKPGETKPGEAKPAGEAKPGGAPGKPAFAGVPVVAAPATQGRIGATLTLSGNITPVQATNLVPKTAGRVEKIQVDVGDKVKAGQQLIQLDRGVLDAAVKQAEANVMSAQARLTTVEKGARPEDIGVARAQLASAQARLTAMESGGRIEDITAAEASVQSAQARLKQVQDGPKEGDVKAADQQVQAAQATFDAAISTLNKLRTPNPDELATARANVDKTRATLAQAQSNYDKVAWRPDITSRTESVALQSATADYQNALAQLRLREQPREEDVATAQKQVDSARALLDANKTKYDQLRVGSSAEDLQIATSTLIQAQQTLAKARQPFTEQDVEAQRQAVRQAEQTLALRAQPYTESDLQTARAGLAQAQAALESAKVNALEGAVVAPYDGVITARLLAEGALTNAQTAAIAIASLGVEVVLNVEEGRIGQLKVGQPATISVPAFPGKLFPAKVSSIAPTADARTHTFSVKVRPEPLDPHLMPGMFAEAKIVTAQKENVVIVPKEAVVQRAGKTVLFVVADGRARQFDVGAGLLVDDKQHEAPSAIKAGDQVIVAGQATVNDGDAVRTGGAPGPGAPGKPQGAGKPDGAGKPEGAPAKTDAAAKTEAPAKQ